MREHATTQADTPPGLILAAPWRVNTVQVLTAYRLQVRFVDGTEGIVDLSRLIAGDNPGVFAALRDPAEFGKVFVLLGAVTWPGEIDLAPDSMYEEIKKIGQWLV
jgi:hypothetical protein